MPRLIAVALCALLLTAAAGSAAAGPPRRVFLPIVATSAPGAMLGLELSSARGPEWVAHAHAAGPTWLRLNGLAWRDVEPAPDAGYSWQAPAVRALEARLARAAELGLTPILVLHGSPRWAVAPHAANCAPIAAAHHGRFARFAGAAVARYSAPPFNVRHYEIGNEPDANLFGADSPYGCWGRKGEPHYGGDAYGRLLVAAYPAIKAASPAAQVLNGGLLLDAPYNPVTGVGESGRFLEGMLEAGAGHAFDLLAFHSYSYYNGTPDGTLGAKDWKPAYLRGVLARYGLQKPLINTESALLCPAATAACAMAQAHAIPRLYVRALRDGLVGQIWYAFDSDSFQHTALVEPGDPRQQRPAYKAFVQAGRALAGMSYGGPVAGLPTGAEGHSLVAGGRTTYVLWSAADQTARLPVAPGAQVVCATWEGVSSPCAASGGALTLGLGPAPLYVTVRRP
ncbi:MAG TPA: hypothetical protein PKD53_24135 [Chloroflexaceae bacterium]|nr:hypothetical protein [Chloroflexaceae bacterium]